MIDPEIQRAQDARVPYVEPEGLGRPEGRRTRQRPNVSVVESYLTQQHVWRSADGTVVTRAAAAGRPSAADLAESEQPDRWLVTAWNPVGNRRTLAQNEAANDRLARDVEAAGGQVHAVVATVPPDRSWVEDTLVVSGLDEDALIAIALDYWQPAFAGLSPTTLTVVSTGLIPGLRRAVAMREDVVGSPTCPMRSDDEPGALCTMRGGPWISAAIHAAAIWRVHRGLLLSRLGCRPCADGTRPTLGPLGKAVGPIEVRPNGLDLASRYGGYVWR